MIKPDTFGNPAVYKCLPGLAACLNRCTKNQRAYASKLIARFNVVCNSLPCPASKHDVRPRWFFEYLFDMVKTDFDNRSIELVVKGYDIDFVNHYRCFVASKISRMKAWLKKYPI